MSIELRSLVETLRLLLKLERWIKMSVTTIIMRGLIGILVGTYLGGFILSLCLHVVEVRQDPRTAIGLGGMLSILRKAALWPLKLVGELLGISQA